MRSVFLLILLVGSWIAVPVGTLSYISSDPPIATVQTGNIALLARFTGGPIAGSNGFDNCFVESAGERMTASRVIASGSAFVRIFGLFPAIDDRISASYPPSAYWAFGQDMRTYQWSTENCDYRAYPSVTWNHRLDFTFLNSTQTVQNPSSRPTGLPSKTIADLAYGNGITVINASVMSTMDINYRIIQCCVGSPDCADEYETIRVRCKDSKEYRAEGFPISRLRVSPPVREQWYQDNRFDNAVVAQRRFYKGAAYLNGEVFATFKLHNFSVYQDQYGFQRIYTAEIEQNINMTANEAVSNQTHEWILMPGSFSTYYQLNTSYDGIGWNNLTLELYDQFGHAFNYTDEIHSRKLSYDENLSEDALPTAGDDLRPSRSWDGGSYDLTEIAVSGAFVGILIAIFMLRRKG